MPRLPSPGGDDDTWGDILNTFLSVSLDPTNGVDGGKIKSTAISDAGGQLTSEKGAASGYASLDGSTKVPIAQIPTGTTSTTVSLGDHTHTKSDVGLGNVTNDAQLKASDLDTDGTLTANSDTKIASQKATKTYSDALVGASIKSGGIGYRTAGLETWFSKFDAATSGSPVDVVMITDSIWDIGSLLTDPSPVSLLARQLNALKGMRDADSPGGSSLPAIVHAQPGSGPSATSSQGTINSSSTAMQGSTLTNGQILTHTATCTSFTVVYQTDPSYGTLTIKDGPGGATLGTINCSATAKSGNMWTSSAISDASHTLHITSTGTTCVELISPNKGQSVRVWPVGLAGATSNQFYSSTSTALDFIDTLEAAGTLGLVIVATGVNDDANYSTRVPALISAVQGHTSADMALWLSYINNAFQASEYGPARVAAFATGLPVIDASMVADQAVTVDLTHPATQTRVLMATQVASVIGGDPIGSALRYAGNPYIGRGTSNMRLSETGLTINNDTGIFRAEVAGKVAVGSPLSLILGTPDGVVTAGLQRTLNPQTGTSYSVVLSDNSKVITRNNASASTQTWPKDSTAAISIGAIIETTNSGAGTIVHSAEVGATITGTLNQPPGTTAKAIKTAVDTWFISVSLGIDTDGTLAANSDTIVSSQKAVKAYADKVASSTLLDGSTTYRSNLLDQWLTKLSTSNTAGPLDIVVLGDSIAGSSDTNSTTARAWPWVLSDLLARKDYYSRYPASPGTPQDVPDGWSPAKSNWGKTMGTCDGTTTNAGFGRYSSIMANGDVATHTVNLDAISVLYNTSAVGGKIEVRDGGSGGTLLATIDTAGTARGAQMWTSGALTYGSHDIHLTAVCGGGETVVLNGIYCYSGNLTKGVRVWPAARNGITTATATSDTTFGLDFIEDIDPDLVILATGANDTPANYTTNMQAMIDATKARTSCDIALWGCYAISGLDKYLDAQAVLARSMAKDNNIQLIDAFLMFPNIRKEGYLKDGIHPTDAGVKIIAWHVYTNITGDPLGFIVRELGSKAEQTYVDTQLATKVGGPGSSTDNAITRFDGTNGRTVQTSSITIDDDGNITQLLSNKTYTASPVLFELAGGASRTHVLDHSNPGFIGLRLNSKFQYNQSANLFGAGSLFINQATFTNQNGVTANLAPVYSFMDGSVFQADNASINFGALNRTYSFISNPTLGTVNSGTLALGTHYALSSAIVVNSGATITDRKSVFISDATGTGTVTNQIGVDIEAFTKGATSNIGIRIAKANTYSLQLSGTDFSAASGITFGTDTNLYRSAADTLKTDDKLLVTGELELDGALNHDGATVGLFGATPASQSTGWSVSNEATLKSYDANATSINEMADVLGTLIEYLKLIGILGA